MVVIVVVVVLFLAAVLLRLVLLMIRRVRKARNSELDYSFGLQKAKKALNLLKKGQFEDLEQLLLSLNSDHLTVTIDHLALSEKSAQFERWQTNSTQKDLTQLCLGVHFIHQAWMSRTHAYAEDVSSEGRLNFEEFQSKSLDCLTSISTTSPLIGEVYSRLIRVYMGTEIPDMVIESFQKAKAKAPNQVWPYLHYCEAIEPKWQGDRELIDPFLKQLPNVPLIQDIVEMKLLADSFQASENYFGGTMEALNQRAQTALVEIDGRVSKNAPNSIHKYILYGYLAIMAENLDRNDLRTKYIGLLQGYYPLYPFGIVQ